MKMRSGRYAFLALVMTAAVSVMMAAPSGATVHSYNMEMVEGSINVNDTMFQTPGVGIEECPGGTSITGTVNTTTNTVTGVLDIESPFVSPIDSEDYVLEATGTADTHGTYNAGAGTFANLHFTNITFVIAEFNTETCTTGTQVCTGTATLNVGGGLHNGATLPFATGEQMYVNGEGGVTNVTFSSCPSFVWFFLLSGADLSIGENTDVTPTPPGAIFEQL
ncbi:MAG TPA: hypothetical protein VEW93_10000 [Acidimicrobiales bacterium]|nr:hypothetical protein [Acidimicrobiales bacterium]